MLGSQEVAAFSNSKIFIWPNGIYLGCFQLYISLNVAKSMPSLTSQSCGDILPAVCLSRQDEAIRALLMSDRLKKEDLVKADRCTFGYSTHMNC